MKSLEIAMLIITTIVTIESCILLYIIIRRQREIKKTVPNQYLAFLEQLQKLKEYLFVPRITNELYVDVYSQGYLKATIFLSENRMQPKNKNCIVINEADYYYPDRIKKLIESAKPPL